MAIATEAEAEAGVRSEVRAGAVIEDGMEDSGMTVWSTIESSLSSSVLSGGF